MVMPFDSVRIDGVVAHPNHGVNCSVQVCPRIDRVGANPKGSAGLTWLGRHGRYVPVLLTTRTFEIPMT
jgi:hypothetical protein